MSVDRIRMYVRRGDETPPQEERRKLRVVNKDASSCWFGGNLVQAPRRTASLPRKGACVPNVKQRATLKPILHAERSRTLRVAGQGAPRQLDLGKKRATTPSLPAGAVQMTLAAQQSSTHLSWKPKAGQRVDVHSMVVEAYSDLTSAFDLTVSEACSALRATASRDRKIFDAHELTTNSKTDLLERSGGDAKGLGGVGQPHVGKVVPSLVYSGVLEKESSLSRPVELLREFISPREMNEGWRHRVVDLAQYAQTPQFLLAGYSTRKALCAGYVARGGQFERRADPRQRSTSEERHRKERSLFKSVLLLEWDFSLYPMRGERMSQMKRQERAMWLHMATDYTFRKGSLAHLDLAAWHYPSQSAAGILRALVRALHVQGHRCVGESVERHVEHAASGNEVTNEVTADAHVASQRAPAQPELEASGNEVTRNAAEEEEEEEEEAFCSAAQHHPAASKATPGMGYNTGFDTIDADKDGLITRKEFGAASVRISVEEEAVTGETREAEKTTRKSALAKFNSATFKIRMVNRLRGGAQHARARAARSRAHTPWFN